MYSGIQNNYSDTVTLVETSFVLSYTENKISEMKFMSQVTAIFYVFYVFVDISSCAPLTDGNGIDPEKLDGELLEKIGVKLKLPQLQLLGKTIENVEKKIEEKICDLHPCETWSAWQGCDVRPGQFGSKFRTRRCGINSTTCEMDINSRTEKESAICVGFCPKDYNITKNGYCLKIYADQGRSQDAAEQQCNKDGGHLVNIDNEVKYGDVNSMLQGYTGGVWVDGRRKDVTSPWEFTYGSQKSFFKWCSTCPSNGSSELCFRVYISNGSLVMNDIGCSSTRYTLCELPKTM